VDLCVRASQPPDLTTPQGTRLTGDRDVTLAGGSALHMFDVALDSDDTDKKPAGESDRPSSEAWLTLDAKGPGTLTPGPSGGIIAGAATGPRRLTGNAAETADQKRLLTVM
jgi:hypothetical protein